VSRGSSFDERLRNLIDDQVGDAGFSGVVLVTQGDMTLHATAGGLANRAWDVPNTVDTLFATASVAKTITAVAVLQLVEEGRITLDQPARAIVPLEGSAIGADVSVHHLLTHTSGIGDHLPEDDGAGPVGTGQVPAPRTRGVADLLPLFVDLPPRFPAGARYAYCNAGFVLLGRIIELVTGSDYVDLVTDRVLRPAGMDRACFPTIDTVVSKLADPHARVPDGAGGWRWIRCLSTALPPAPDGGLVASAEELDRFWRVLLAGGLLGGAWVERMVTPRITIGDDHSYGLGVHLIAAPSGALRYEAHGFDHGVNAFVAHHPDAAINVVVLSNVDAGAVDLYRQISAMLADRGM
jgi:CubicO group peptidase (beta-lactamase class C family)